MNVKTGIAPKTNYQSDAKLKYRKSIWAELSKRVRPNTLAIIMPARGCEEIEAALSFGVPIDCIFCFDASAAVIATSDWRKKYPDIKFAACNLSGLNKKIEKYGRKISAINMDLCGGVAGEVVDEVGEFLGGANFTRRAALAVNIAKGREGRTLLRMLKNMRASDWFKCDRMAALVAMLPVSHGQIEDVSITGTSQGTYRDNKTPMSWATFELRKRTHGHHRKSFIDAIKSAIQLENKTLFLKLVDQEWLGQREFARGSVTGSDAESINYNFSLSMSIKAIPPRGWL
jgi:hypothetical protein